jgi:hypothetical protein
LPAAIARTDELGIDPGGVSSQSRDPFSFARTTAMRERAPAIRKIYAQGGRDVYLNQAAAKMNDRERRATRACNPVLSASSKQYRPRPPILTTAFFSTGKLPQPSNRQALATFTNFDLM